MADNIKIKIDIALDPAGVDQGAAQTQARLDKLAEAMTASFQKSADAERKVTEEGKKLDEQQKTLGETLGGMASKIGAWNLAWEKGYEALAAATRAVKDYLKESALLNARYETMGVVLEVVGRNAGYSKSELEGYSAALQKNGITMLASRESIVRMIQANLDLSQATSLARAAQDAAVIANINSSQAFERLVYAIQSGQPEMLRTMGINVNFEDGYKKLAKQLKVNIDQLTEQEKVQSRANTTLAGTITIAGTYEAAMTTAGKQILSLDRYTENLKVRIGETFNEALVVAVENYTDILKGANEETRQLANDKKLQEWGRDVMTTFAWTGDIVVGAWGAIATAVEQTVSLSLRSMNALRNGLLSAFPGASMIAKLIGAGTGHDLDAMVQAFADEANANLEERLARPQLRNTLEDYLATKDRETSLRDRMKRDSENELARTGYTGLPPKSPAPARPKAGATRAEQEKARREAEWVAQKQIEGEQEFERQKSEAWSFVDKQTLALDKQNKVLDDQAQRWRDLIDPTAKYERQFDELVKLWNAGKLTNEEYIAAFEKTQQAQEKLFKFTREKNPFDDLKQSIEGWGKDFSKTMGAAVVTFDFSMNKMGSAWKSLLADIAAQQIQKNFTDPLVKAAGNVLGNLFGGGSGGSSAPTASYEMHSGGVAGVDGVARMIPAGAFAGARRLHGGGLAANEIPTILERDEEVLTRSDPRHRYNQGGSVAFAPTLVFNVENKGSQPMQVSQSGPAVMTNGKLVVGLLLEELGSNQSSRNALAGVLR